MKRNYSVLALASLVALASACSDGDRPVTPTPGNDAGTDSAASVDSGSDAAIPLPQEDLTGDVTADRTLTADKVWLLKGLVMVKTGVTLTIEKGTLIKGDNATKAILLVQPGGKLVAQGTADEPIVFTSQASQGNAKPGDWGGIVILGQAKVNWPNGKGNVEGFLSTVKGLEYGGTDDDDSSGVISYVRIEYAGVVLSTDNEVNGLTLAGVGRKTKLDHVEVRQALDDCFEFFGGTVDGKYLVCQYNEDDGFDFDNGYTGRLQFLVLQQSPTHAGDDNGFESDNDATGTTSVPFTAPTVFNASLFGKNKDIDKQSYGALIRKNTKGKYANVLFLGFEGAIDVRDSSTKVSANDGTLSFTSSLAWGSNGTNVVEHINYVETGTDKNLLDYDDDGALDEVAWWKDVAKKNTIADPQIAGAFDATKPVFGPKASLTTNAATPPNDGFFDASATYIGAFKDETDTWATKGKWVVWSDK